MTIKPRKSLLWTGRVTSLLVSLMFLFSAAMKFAGGEELEKGMAQSGLPMSLVLPLAILELTCVAIYMIPATAVLGAILLTGYLGGAILTHVRIGDTFVIHIVLGVLVWLGISLREPRLWRLIPVRRSESTPIAAGE